MVRSRSQRRPQTTALRSARRSLKHRRQFVARDDSQAAREATAERDAKRR